jgi:hypothetical protein
VVSGFAFELVDVVGTHQPPSSTRLTSLCVPEAPLHACFWRGWQNYSIVRTKPTFGGRHFYSIARDGKTITRTYETKRAVTKILRLIAHERWLTSIAGREQFWSL